MDPPPPRLLTKILATLGPASADVDTLVRMIEEGVRCVRINFSHGSFDDFAATLHVARAAAKKTGIPLGILGDLSGPKIRVTGVDDPGIELKPGDHVEFVTDGRTASRNARGVTTFSVTYDGLVDDVVAGNRLLINDGAIRMLVTDRVTANDPDPTRDPDTPRLIANVTVGGLVTNKKGVNLPDSTIAAPSMTDHDHACAAWAVEHGLDFLALSFVRKAEDVSQLKTVLQKMGRDHRELRSHSKLPIIAKIEMPQAIRELAAIVEAADGIMVARGDLGVEMDVAEVPILQKKIIACCHDYGKPVIVATQMLESMITAATPTRAEVSDVANAILDGADAIMLSGETAVGQWPVQAVHTMARTAEIAEAYAAEKGLKPPVPTKTVESRYRSTALAQGAEVICRQLKPAYVVTWSELGGGARYLSQRRLPMPCIAVSSNPDALRRMALLFGVTGMYMPRPEPPEAGAKFVEAVDELLLHNHWAQPGDAVVIVKGEPLGTPGVSNKIRIHYVGDVCRLAWHVKT